MSKKAPQRIISLAVEPECHELLKETADKKNISVSQLARELINKYLVVDKEITKIVLSIPKSVLSDSESLQKWLNIRTQAIVHHFKNGSHSS